MGFARVGSNPTVVDILPGNPSQIGSGLLFMPCDSEIRGSIVVSIPACHAGDPGSIPGLGVFCVPDFLS